MSLLPAAALARTAPAHPYLPADHGAPRVKTLDVRTLLAEQGKRVATPVEQPDLSRLDRIAAGHEPADADGENPRTGLPDGWVQRGTMVLPREINTACAGRASRTIFAVEDIPGNEYPRKHTLYLNFTGGEPKFGTDNSAENTRSWPRPARIPRGIKASRRRSRSHRACRPTSRRSASRWCTRRGRATSRRTPWR
ncbi:MAG: hypothetical protein U0168_28770 [Nannocystaceae bacterium]